MREVREFCDTVIRNVETVIVGKRDVIELVLVALLSEGHVLFEDFPGTGKTMLARSVAASLGLTFKRIQCTPDLLPNDVTGVSVFNQKTQEFDFRPGPAFSNVVLADEINRATPRTQSALLESMGERQITVDGETHVLPRPFLVLATQNPIEFEGTFPLPEAQLDRFLMRLRVGYPTFEDERQILHNLRRAHPIERIGQVVNSEMLLNLMEQVWEVYVEDTARDYIVNIVRATRQHPELSLGGSPRGTLALFRASQALAAVSDRDYVIPDDVKRLARPTLAHRLILRPESALRGRTAEAIVDNIVENVAVTLGEEARV